MTPSPGSILSVGTSSLSIIPGLVVSATIDVPQAMHASTAKDMKVINTSGFFQSASFILPDALVVPDVAVNLVRDCCPQGLPPRPSDKNFGHNFIGPQSEHVCNLDDT